ncbi:hypothetical protein B9Z19DRAFT_1194014 [Tuber borchii]|uniref:Calpain catalytic domain-containing protein n=1 Tax=Tuber borchii TaxID=42251 RepID=A0A2T6ZPQ8_TUBBO|nr:hypothetical protein B9Z19DRAFT_1194014 [Tuber borchii]
MPKRDGEIETSISTPEMMDGPALITSRTKELESGLNSAGVARFEEIFDKPKFFKDGVSAAIGDIHQGALLGVTTIANVSGLVEKICQTFSLTCGYATNRMFLVLSLCAISTIVGDQLYLRTQKYYDAGWHVQAQFSGKGKEYSQTFVQGPEALLFAKCEDKNETWLPLLEKAEGVEDLTGGVTSELYTCDILDKDRFWREEILQVNKNFLFAAGILGSATVKQSRIISEHAYSFLKAREAKRKRFVLIRNPWGSTEWIGPWSDGSKE